MITYTYTYTKQKTIELVKGFHQFYLKTFIVSNTQCGALGRSKEFNNVCI